MTHEPEPWRAAVTARGAASHPEAVLEVLFTHAGVGLGLWDTDLRFVRLNETLAAINGRPIEDHLGSTPSDILGGLGDPVMEILRQVLTSGKPVLDHELSGETSAEPGLTRHWRASYYPVLDDGAVVAVAAAVLEVTAEREAGDRERKALERAHAASAMLDALVDSAPVGIGFWDSDFRYQRLNQALADMNAASIEEHIGRTPVEVMGEMGERVLACLVEAAQTREPVLEVELTGTVDGSVQHRQGSWFPVFGEDGEVVGIGCVARDVTDRHAAQADRMSLLRDALTARAHANAAVVRSEAAQRDAEEAGREAEQARAEAEFARARTQFLVDAGARMAASMDYEATLRELARTVVPRLADWCSIVTAGPRGHLAVEAVAHIDPALTHAAYEHLRRFPPRRGASHGAAHVIRSGEAELLTEMTDDILVALARDEDELRSLRNLGLSSMLTVPLRAAGVTLGAISLMLSHSSRRFPPEDADLAQALGDLAGLHMRNAQLYTERSHIARTLQRSLLPRALPAIPGMEVAARYEAAGNENEVGGDFYDVFQADEGVWAALIGDVSGKGAEAAAVTSLARHTLRTSTLQEPGPALNLATLNRALMAEVETTRFCTVLYVRVRPFAHGAQLTISNGGHLAPRLLRPGVGVETLDIRGTLVGAVGDARFQEVGLTLEPGATLVMFTDGVTEVRGKPPDYGERELDRALAGLAGQSAEDVAQAILVHALDMHDGDPRDDMALVVLRMRPTADDGGRP